jgi:hypothetical protein
VGFECCLAETRSASRCLQAGWHGKVEKKGTRDKRHDSELAGSTAVTCISGVIRTHLWPVAQASLRTFIVADAVLLFRESLGSVVERIIGRRNQELLTSREACKERRFEG